MTFSSRCLADSVSGDVCLGAACIGWVVIADYKSPVYNRDNNIRPPNSVTELFVEDYLVIV